MAIIEGIGDEVVLVVGTFLALVFMTLAWFSTQVRERPRPEVVVLDRSRIVRALQRIRTATTNTLTQTPVGYVIRSTNSNDSTASADSRETVQTPDSSSAGSNEQVSVLYAEVRGNQPPDAPQTSSSDNASNDQAQSTADTAPVTVHDIDADRAESSEASNSNASEVRQRKNIDTGKTTAETHDAPATSSPGSPPSGQDTADDPETERLDGHIRVRLKYLDERQRLVQARPGSTIEQFKRLFFDSEISESTSVRLIFNGQELSGDRTLQSYNVEDRCVIHCMLSRSAAPERSNTIEQGLPFDMATLAFPLFGMILVLIWYCRVTYRAYFNPMSTFSLIGITFLYLVALMASFRSNRNHEHVH